MAGAGGEQYVIERLVAAGRRHSLRRDRFLRSRLGSVGRFILQSLAAHGAAHREIKTLRVVVVRGGRWCFTSKRIKLNR
jgi:hypothetical protein